MEIIRIPIDELTPDPNNAKDHPAWQVEQIKNSIEQFGNCDPIGVWGENNLVVEGNGRLEALKELGYTEAECIRLDWLTEEERRAYALAHNKLTMNSGFIPEALDTNLAAVGEIDMSLFGFDADITGDNTEHTEVLEDDFDAEPPEEPKAKRGEVYQLGRHRLMCGDSTNTGDVAKLMNGEKADMVFTDPPYNIAGKSKNIAADVSKAMGVLANSEWDKNFDFVDVQDRITENIKGDSSVYICTSHFLAGQIWEWMSKWADFFSYCVWSKPNPMPSLMKRHWTWNTELICYATIGKHIFNFPKEGHLLSTWTINKNNEHTGHPTEKPVSVPAMAIEHSSNVDMSVLDLFGGSGSTLMACEQLNRRCFMMEYDPKYIDVIINRWEKYTGQKAVLL